jgi:hypothetical protein
MRQPWIRSARYDGLLILAPPFLALLVVLALPAAYRSTASMPVLAWVVLVVLIDVAHTYGTLFQTYFDPLRRQQYRALLWLVPLACYAAGVALHSLGDLVFWRVLAYLAVFHFIRQQYGFLRIYSRFEAPAPGQWVATALVYYATIYPLLYWHLSPGRHFNWFIEGEFVQVDWPLGRQLATVLYVLLIGAYAGREWQLWQRTRRLNLPRNLLLGGTLLSWYAGHCLVQRRPGLHPAQRGIARHSLSGAGVEQWSLSPYRRPCAPPGCLGRALRAAGVSGCGGPAGLPRRRLLGRTGVAGARPGIRLVSAAAGHSQPRPAGLAGAAAGSPPGHALRTRRLHLAEAPGLVVSCQLSVVSCLFWRGPSLSLRGRRPKQSVLSLPEPARYDALNNSLSIQKTGLFTLAGESLREEGLPRPAASQ